MVYEDIYEDRRKGGLLRMRKLTKALSYGYGPILFAIFIYIISVFFIFDKDDIHNIIILGIILTIICIFWLCESPQYILYDDEKVIFYYHPIPYKSMLSWKEISNIKIDKKWNSITIEKRKQPKYTQLVVKNTTEEIQEFIQTFNNSKKKLSGW